MPSGRLTCRTTFRQPGRQKWKEANWLRSEKGKKFSHRRHTHAHCYERSVTACRAGLTTSFSCGYIQGHQLSRKLLCSCGMNPKSHIIGKLSGFRRGFRSVAILVHRIDV